MRRAAKAALKRRQSIDSEHNDFTQHIFKVDNSALKKIRKQMEIIKAPVMDGI